MSWHLDLRKVLTSGLLACLVVEVRGAGGCRPRTDRHTSYPEVGRPSSLHPCVTGSEGEHALHQSSHASSEAALENSST